MLKPCLGFYLEVLSDGIVFFEIHNPKVISEGYPKWILHFELTPDRIIIDSEYWIIFWVCPDSPQDWLLRFSYYFSLIKRRLKYKVFGKH